MRILQSIITSVSTVAKLIKHFVHGVIVLIPSPLSKPAKHVVKSLETQEVFSQHFLMRRQLDAALKISLDLLLMLICEKRNKRHQ